MRNAPPQTPPLLSQFQLLLRVQRGFSVRNSMAVALASGVVARQHARSCHPSVSSRSSRFGRPQGHGGLIRPGQVLPRQDSRRDRVNFFAADEQRKSAKAGADDDEDLPPWVRREREKKAAEQTGDLPFGLYLLFSSFVAIAAIGSIFEFANKNSLFGVVQPDSPLWAPILLTFAITGLPTAGFLFVKAISAANKAAEAMDQVDGY